MALNLPHDFSILPAILEVTDNPIVLVAHRTPAHPEPKLDSPFYVRILYSYYPSPSDVEGYWPIQHTEHVMLHSMKSRATILVHILCAYVRWTDPLQLMASHS
jgi:hypothetical protein